jgi:aminoglycoside phosphotransferase (APT) family kinase protein
MRKPDADLAALRNLVSRAFPGSTRLSLERAEAGVSTQVYRIRRGDEVYYLRVAERREDSLAPEVHVHNLLREKGVRIPEVVYFEPFDEGLERSVMVTTEIPGEPIARGVPDVDARRILGEASRDLATINSVPVGGFGWIRRDGNEVGLLRGERHTYREWRLEDLEEHLRLLGRTVMRPAETRAIERIVGRYDAWLNVDGARLAHGDLDATHIYHDGGEYTGIIDFGEIRGAEPLYDLGHYKLHDGEMLPYRTLPYLLEGYAEVSWLPNDFQRRISFSSLLIGMRALARSVRKDPRAPHNRLLRASIEDDLQLLLA